MDVITSSSSSEGRGMFGVDSESLESTNSATSGDNDASGRNFFCLPPPFQSDSLQTYSFGDPGSLQHRIVFCDADNQEVISPYNDIPLYGPDRLLRCICTTPAGSSIRRQIAEDEPYHPLRVCQRAADANLSGHFRDDAPWNVCILPQTQTLLSAANIDYYGGESTLAPDLRRCPAEFIDLGADKARKVGDVYLVMPLAAFVVVDVRDRRQICWKIVGVAADDPMADKLLGTVDAHDEIPGILELVREWIRSDLCIEEGDGGCSLLLDNRAASLDMALSAIQQLHRSWLLLAETAERQIASALPLPSGRSLTSAALATYWQKYTQPSTSTFHPPSNPEQPTPTPPFDPSCTCPTPAPASTSKRSDTSAPTLKPTLPLRRAHSLHRPSLSLHRRSLQHFRNDAFSFLDLSTPAGLSIPAFRLSPSPHPLPSPSIHPTLPRLRTCISHSPQGSIDISDFLSSASNTPPSRPRGSTTASPPHYFPYTPPRRHPLPGSGDRSPINEIPPEAFEIAQTEADDLPAFAKSYSLFTFSRSGSGSGRRVKAPPLTPNKFEDTPGQQVYATSYARSAGGGGPLTRPRSRSMDLGSELRNLLKMSVGSGRSELPNGKLLPVQVWEKIKRGSDVKNKGKLTYGGVPARRFSAAFLETVSKSHLGRGVWDKLEEEP